MKDEGLEVTRGPDHVNKVWDEQVDGAWAPGKAPMSQLITFLKCVQERDSVKAEHAAHEILNAEPNNRLVRDLLDAMKQQAGMDVEEDELFEVGSYSKEQSEEEEGSLEGSDERLSEYGDEEDYEAEADVKGTN